jgi:hypothetical protein
MRTADIRADEHTGRAPVRGSQRNSGARLDKTTLQDESCSFSESRLESHGVLVVMVRRGEIYLAPTNRLPSSGADA